MEWWVPASFLFGAFVILLIIGMPVSFSFWTVNVIGVLVFWGGLRALSQLVLDTSKSVGSFTLLPIILFILMGEVMFDSGVALRMIDAVDKWLGRLPGRLALVAVGGGTIFATMSGSSMAGVALLGSVLAPEMEKRGYKKSISLGPIMGAGGLATMIPPSALGVICGSLGKISVGGLLMAIIVPGLLLATLYAAYIIVRCTLRPSDAPAYELERIPISRKLELTIKYIIPQGVIIFLVIGVMFLGIATPSEAAALGTVGSFALAVVYGSISWLMAKTCLINTVRVTGMVFLMLTGALAFSQILAYTGASAGLLKMALAAPLSPMALLFGMMVILIIMGCFMEPMTIMTVTFPIYMPIVQAMGWDPIWFGVLVLINMEMAIISPPFGLSLFTMKGVAPPGTTIGDVYKAAVPFMGLQLLALILVMIFPSLALWLPSTMQK